MVFVHDTIKGMAVTNNTTKGQDMADKKVTCEQFQTWLKFFRGADVTVGTGKAVWTLAGGHYQNLAEQGIARITRPRYGTRNGLVTYRVKFETLRLAGEK